MGIGTSQGSVFVGVGVLVKWSTVTGYHRLGDGDNRNLFLTIPEPRMSKIKVPVSSVSGGDWLLLRQWLSSHTRQKVGDNFLKSLY